MIERRVTAGGRPVVRRDLRVSADHAGLEAHLSLPEEPTGLVVFAHRAGSGHTSPRNRHIARGLQARGLATLLVDLLTPGEEAVDFRTRALRHDPRFLGRRVLGVVHWLRRRTEVASLPLGIMGSGTGAAGAVVAAGAEPGVARALVLRSGHLDLAHPAVPGVSVPTLLIVGGADHDLVDENRRAAARFGGPVRLDLVPGASRDFQEAGTLDEAARLAGDWFVEHLSVSTAPGPG